MKSSILVIDDDAMSCRLVDAIFRAEGLSVDSAADGRSGLARAKAHPPDAVLLDVRLPDMDGIDVLESLRKRDADLPVVMVTGDHDMKTAVRAMHLGAYDYLSKPIDREQLIATVRRALEARALRVEVLDLRRRLFERTPLAEQMGPSDEVKEIEEKVRTVARSRFTVLLSGETGTGKELVAQAIHRESDRSHRPFVALDCGAIPEPLLESELFGHERGAFTGADRKKSGQFQLAEGGTLFLDEIGNLPLSLQAKLLRVLESQQVAPLGATRATPMNVRFLAATNDDLEERVRQGRFRADLYFRLAQFVIPLPPLRARKVDIAYLARRFSEEAAIELRRPVGDIHVGAIDLLERHRWPGNVRELRNVVRQAVLTARELVLRKELFRPLLGSAARTESRSLDAGSSLKEIAIAAVRAAEHDAITATLRSTKGNKSQAARLLRTDYKTLHLKIKSFGIRPADYRT